MKAYTYRPQDIGLDRWPEGELRLDGFEPVTDPHQADVFICPGPLSMFQNENDLDRFPFIESHEDQHVFFDCSDHATLYTRRMPILIRCNLRPFMLAAHPNSISWSWPVEDYADCVEVPAGGFRYDVSFHGWVTSHATRQHSTASCLANKKLNCDLALYSDFTGYIYHTPEGIRRRQEFRRSMRESRIALCPESINGVFPYRFWEAMSAGRVPLLVGSDFIFPFEDEIPYDSFSLQCSRGDAGEASKVAAQFLASHSDSEIIELGLMARHYWEKYLNSADWPKTMARAVEKQLQARLALR